MDFHLKKRQRSDIKLEVVSLETKYPHNVMLYKYPPTDDIHIEEFEELALERLRLLRVFDRAATKALRMLSDDWKAYVNAELTREGLRNYLRLCTGGDSKHESDIQTRRRDYISHFILRLAYCRSEDLSRWFIAREMDYFKYKFSALSGPEIKQFLDVVNFSFQPLTEAQKDQVKDGLYESTAGQSVAKIELLDFYKVPFTQVLDLVRSRRCYLKAGFAYVNTHDLVSLVGTKHMDEIEQGLAAAKVFIDDIESDERISRMLKALHNSYVGKDYTVCKDAAVPIESLDQLSKTSYPLCMRMCHEHLRANHHIKHGGRMQYGLFLKGIGVTLEDSLRFWREEFTKKMDADKFARSYEYNINHNYGKKGSMVNYTPYSCLKIIKEMAAPGDCHGCPYKAMDPVSLKTKMSSYGLSPSAIDEVMRYATSGHYQLACSKYFMITHNSTTEPTINHPNGYFEESQIVMGNRQKRVTGSQPQQHQPNKLRSAIKGGADRSMMMGNDDDELWRIAETQERTLQSQQELSQAFDDDLDLTEIQY
ncbi:DNA primase large subunit [Scaptodrosophila lebanonensis]|uniref:DNA primase large subunit n=1 Tax=Drosophila lebanonensis TaxID=7225 RepID=A0A6J2TJ63_DROLE|nr:DNA primase large subunit [Scaptodrosophila lebanonensis]